MAKNELLPFAGGEDANVLPTNQWEALTDILENGFQSGIARSEQVNRVLAQGAVASYVLGQLIVDQLNKDATLDKDTLYQNLVSALQENAKDACLPLSGGTMTGDIKVSGNRAIKQTTTSSSFQLYGGTSADYGSVLGVYGVDHSERPGWIFGLAKSGTDGSTFIGKPDGTLTWRGKEVERVNSKGVYYTRFESGLQICWGQVSFDSAGVVNVTLPVAFKDGSYKVCATMSSSSTNFFGVSINSRTSTGFPMRAQSGTSFMWVAVGLWK